LITPFCLAFRHLILNNTDDGHKNGAAHAAAGDIAQNAGEVHRTAASCCASQCALKERSSEAAADNSGDVISHCSKLFSFMAAPATLPPTAPLIASVIRLMMFIGLVSCFVRACIDLLGLRTRHTAKSESPFHESKMARTQWSHRCDEGHAALRLPPP